jgi:hypothetical protein
MRSKQWSGAMVIALAILFAAALTADKGSNEQAVTNPIPGC